MASARQTASADARSAVIDSLHVADAGFFARFGRMFRQLALGLDPEGVGVTLVTDHPPALREFESTPVTCRLTQGLSGWRTLLPASRLADAFQPVPTLVHLWGTPALSAVSSITGEAGIPLLVHALTRNDVERLTRRGTRAHEYLAAGCRGFCEALTSRRTAEAPEVALLPPALIPPSPRSRAVRSDAVPGVLFVGRIDEHGGVELLIEALAQVRAKGAELQVGLIGQGPRVGAVWREVRARGLADCVSLIDQPRFWDGALRGADALVVPSCQDELSLAPLLAMAGGTIVIASRDQVGDWFVEDQTARQFTPGSAVELAFHLSRVVSGYEGNRRLAESAARYVRENHDLVRVAARLSGLYREVRRHFADRDAAHTPAGGRGS